MPDFGQIKWDDPAAKGLIGSFILVLVGLVFTVHAEFTGAGDEISKMQAVICISESCGYKDVLSPGARRKLAKQAFEELQSSDPERAQRLIDNANLFPNRGDNSTEDIVLQTWGNKITDLPYTCPKCNQKTLCNAVKCEKCGEIFFGGQFEGDYWDRCPKCQFSKKEQIIKERKDANKKR